MTSAGSFRCEVEKSGDDPQGLELMRISNLAQMLST
jgi:hypothetical protein